MSLTSSSLREYAAQSDEELAVTLDHLLAAYRDSWGRHRSAFADLARDAERVCRARGKPEIYLAALDRAGLPRPQTEEQPAMSDAPEKPDPAEVLTQRLAEPFGLHEVKFRPTNIRGNRCLALPYVDARCIQERLDEVVGVTGWQDEYQPLPDGSVVCSLKLRIGEEWVTKMDVGGPSEQPDGGDRMKAAFSDALKRAAVKFGVGRYLYNLPAIWTDYDPQKKTFVKSPTLPAASRKQSAAPAKTDQAPAKLTDQVIARAGEMGVALAVIEALVGGPLQTRKPAVVQKVLENLRPLSDTDLDQIDTYLFDWEKANNKPEGEALENVRKLLRRPVGFTLRQLTIVERDYLRAEWQRAAARKKAEADKKAG